MIPENKPRKNYWYGFYEGHESRCRGRLQKDLGVDEEAAEIILHLRKQVVELQSHIRQLETELDAQFENEDMRLTQYRENSYEARWIELDIQE
jgi:hypothetical protein